MTYVGGVVCWQVRQIVKVGVSGISWFFSIRVSTLTSGVALSLLCKCITTLIIFSFLPLCVWNSVVIAQLQSNYLVHAFLL